MVFNVFTLYLTCSRFYYFFFRVLLLSASQGFPLVPQKSLKPNTASELFKCYSDVDDIQIYKADSPAFYRMFNLVTNFDKMNNNDYIQYALVSMYFTFCFLKLRKRILTNVTIIQKYLKRLQISICRQKEAVIKGEGKECF